MDTDPILAIGNLEAWWDRDGIDSSATVDGNNVDTWTDAIAGRVLNKVTGTQPVLELNGSLRAVRFDGTNAMRIAEWSGVDFLPGTDAFTIVVKLGNDPGSGGGTLIGKQLDGSDEIQYQFARANLVNMIQMHAGTTAAQTTYTRWDTGSTINSEANQVYSIAVGTASATDVTAYEGTTSLSLDTGSSPYTNGHSNNYDIYVGARWAGSGDSIGFAFDGSIAHLLIFSKKLNFTEISTVVANLS